MPEYRVTFGVQYAHDPHPRLPDIAHPDGWATIDAPNETAARAVAVGVLGYAWSNLYSDDTGQGWTRHPDEWARWYPRGELLRITLPTGGKS